MKIIQWYESLKMEAQIIIWNSTFIEIAKTQ